MFEIRAAKTPAFITQMVPLVYIHVLGVRLVLSGKTRPGAVQTTLPPLITLFIGGTGMMPSRLTRRRHVRHAHVACHRLAQQH